VPKDPKTPDTPLSGIDVTKVGVGGIVVIPTQIDITQVLQVLDAATNLQNIDQYKQLQPALAKAVGDLKTYLTRQDAQISSLQNQLTNAQTQITTLQNANNDLTNQVAALNAQVTQLKAQLASQPQKALRCILRNHSKTPWTRSRAMLVRPAARRPPLPTCRSQLRHWSACRMVPLRTPKMPCWCFRIRARRPIRTCYRR